MNSAHVVFRVGSLDRVQGDFVTRWTEQYTLSGDPLSRFIRLCGHGCIVPFLSLSLASRCRRRSVFAALPKKRYKTGASRAWPEGRGRGARGNRTRHLAERNGNGCREKLMGNAHLEKAAARAGAGGKTDYRQTIGRYFARRMSVV